MENNQLYEEEDATKTMDYADLGKNRPHKKDIGNGYIMNLKVTVRDLDSFRVDGFNELLARTTWLLDRKTNKEYTGKSFN